jgi:hypothetical protein
MRRMLALAMLAVAVAVAPAAAAAQDLRSPDRVDAATPARQDLRAPDRSVPLTWGKYAPPKAAGQRPRASTGSDGSAFYALIIPVALLAAGAAVVGAVRVARMRERAIGASR